MEKFRLVLSNVILKTKYSYCLKVTVFAFFCTAIMKTICISCFLQDISIISGVCIAIAARVTLQPNLRKPEKWVQLFSLRFIYFSWVFFFSIPIYFFSSSSSNLFAYYMPGDSFVTTESKTSLFWLGYFFFLGLVIKRQKELWEAGERCNSNLNY